jgi:hypothetical protein
VLFQKTTLQVPASVDSIWSSFSSSLIQFDTYFTSFIRCKMETSIRRWLVIYRLKIQDESDAILDTFLRTEGALIQTVSTKDTTPHWKREAQGPTTLRITPDLLADYKTGYGKRFNRIKNYFLQLLTTFWANAPTVVVKDATTRFQAAGPNHSRPEMISSPSGWSELISWIDVTEILFISYSYTVTL